MPADQLSSEAIDLLLRLRERGSNRHFDANAAWELIQRDYARIKKDPFRLEITPKGTAAAEPLKAK